MLCDYVQLNAGSHVLIIDKTSRINDEQFTYSLAYEPKSEELLAIVLHTIAIRISSCLLLFQSQINQFIQIIAESKNELDS